MPYEQLLGRLKLGNSVDTRINVAYLSYRNGEGKFFVEITNGKYAENFVHFPFTDGRKMVKFVRSLIHELKEV